MPNFAFHNFEQLLKHIENTGKAHGAHRENTGNIQGKHMEPTGKTNGKHRENTWSPQGKHREHTGKSQGLHNPTIAALYRSVFFGKNKNTKKYTPNGNIFIPNFAFHNFEQLLFLCLLTCKT